MIKLSQLPERITKFIEPEPFSGCWLSSGGCTSRGYPSMQFGARHIGLYRALYEMYIGGIEEGCDVHHKCRTPACVNPNHLEMLSRADHRRLQLTEQTHCKNGHEFTPENTGWWGGRRLCRACRVINSQNWALAHMEVA